MELVVPLVGVWGWLGLEDRVGAGLDEVQECPGDPVAVVGSEAGNEGSRFLSYHRLADRFELGDTPIYLFLLSVQSGSGPAATKVRTSGLMP
ncbi:hypothetical protein [Streptomyces nymphaeiformis]|uniref:Uncharacterized protein n=1 Tax=Streptomyces nymphaeiformis TaxID=2663842 RepID=A0A7W7XGZ4_9ACTN|nr:hypothetical protein [Streptomyces nymphaeiformis]MBB4986673.1 hypothetical protein [Streptomyces nymphaeiformis]